MRDVRLVKVCHAVFGSRSGPKLMAHQSVSRLGQMSGCIVSPFTVTVTVYTVLLRYCS